MTVAPVRGHVGGHGVNQDLQGVGGGGGGGGVTWNLRYHMLMPPMSHR